MHASLGLLALLNLIQHPEEGWRKHLVTSSHADTLVEAAARATRPCALRMASRVHPSEHSVTPGFQWPVEAVRRVISQPDVQKVRIQAAAEPDGEPTLVMFAVKSDGSFASTALNLVLMGPPYPEEDGGSAPLASREKNPLRARWIKHLITNAAAMDMVMNASHVPADQRVFFRRDGGGAVIPDRIPAGFTWPVEAVSHLLQQPDVRHVRIQAAVEPDGSPTAVMFAIDGTREKTSLALNLVMSGPPWPR